MMRRLIVAVFMKISSSAIINGNINLLLQNALSLAARYQVSFTNPLSSEAGNLCLLYTYLIDWFIHCNEFWSFQTKPDQTYLTWSWSTWPTHPPELPTQPTLIPNHVYALWNQRASGSWRLPDWSKESFVKSLEKSIVGLIWASEVPEEPPRSGRNLRGGGCSQKKHRLWKTLPSVCTFRIRVNQITSQNRQKPPLNRQYSHHTFD